MRFTGHSSPASALQTLAFTNMVRIVCLVKRNHLENNIWNKLSKHL